MVKVEFNSTFLNPGFSNVICILSYRYLSGFFKGAFFYVESRYGQKEAGLYQGRGLRGSSK
jgi:hypothetical protein